MGDIVIRLVAGTGQAQGLPLQNCQGEQCWVGEGGVEGGSMGIREISFSRSGPSRSFGGLREERKDGCSLVGRIRRNTGWRTRNLDQETSVCGQNVYALTLKIPIIGYQSQAFRSAQLRNDLVVEVNATGSIIVQQIVHIQQGKAAFHRRAVHQHVSYIGCDILSDRFELPTVAKLFETDCWGRVSPDDSGITIDEF